MRRPEQEIQIAVVQLLELLYPPGRSAVCWFHPPQGGKRGGKTNRRGAPIEAGILKGMGARAGVSDLVFLWATGSAVLELKAGRGRVSDAQKDWLGWCDLADVAWAICRSVGEVEAAIRHWVEAHGMPEPECWRRGRARSAAM